MSREFSYAKPEAALKLATRTLDVRMAAIRYLLTTAASSYRVIEIRALAAYECPLPPPRHSRLSERTEPILLVGGHGTRKSHLVTGVAIAACDGECASLPPPRWSTNWSKHSASRA
jgi:hypothetical protein